MTRKWRHGPPERDENLAQHLGSHPGGLVPVAFAVGQDFAIAGTQLLRAADLGYDVGSRVVMATETTRNSAASVV